MRCPSCHIEYPPETHECPKCGVVLAKWHSGKPLTTPKLEGEERSSPIILYGGLALAVLGGIYYWRAPGGAPAETVHMQAPPPPAPAAPGGTEASAPLAPEAPAQDGWRFEGTVFNLRTGAPVVIPRHGARRGHPALFARAVFTELHRAPSDTGARAVVRGAERVFTPFEATRCAGIGNVTRTALEREGIDLDFQPTRSTSAAMAA